MSGPSKENGTNIDLPKKPDREGQAVIRKDAPSAEVRVRELQTQRRRESDQLMGEGRTLKDLVTHFDNNYGPLEDLYREKTGADLIADPYDADRHEIPIEKSCSMVIPAYNAGEQLHKTLLAAQASTFNARYPGQFEVIVVDDESPTVDLGQLVSQWDDLDDLKVKVIRQSNGRENKGRYSGVLAAQGDVILFTSQDIVNSPTMIEEYMKRHEVLGDVACFGFINEVDPDDPRIDNNNIANGSLGELPLRYDHDFRVREEGMADSDWLKEGGSDRPLPINTNEEQSWSWHLRDLTWSAALSAPRDVLLKTMCSYDDRYKGYGSDEGQVAADLIAEGLYIIPNTGGIAFHQTHQTRNNPVEGGLNEQVYFDNLSRPPRRQDAQSPVGTDARETYVRENTRTERTTPLGEPEPDRYKHAVALMQMGVYPEAAALFSQMEGEHGEDVWFLHDQAQTLIALGGRANTDQAISVLEAAVWVDAQEEKENDWVHVRLAEAYGRRGEEGDYERSLEEYRNVQRINPDNPEIKFLVEADEDRYGVATKLRETSGAAYMERGKPRSALKCYDRAIALVGEEGEPWSVFDKGKALLALGNMPEAITTLEKAVALMPHETWTHSELARAYDRAGIVDKTNEELRRALSIGNNHDALEMLAGQKKKERD